MQGILRHVLRILTGPSDSHTVVGPISQSEVAGLRSRVQLVLQLFRRLEPVQLDRARELLLVIKLFAKALW